MSLRLVETFNPGLIRLFFFELSSLRSHIYEISSREQRRYYKLRKLL